MPQYSIETSTTNNGNTTRLVLRTVQEDEPVGDDERVINVNDIDLLYGAIVSNLSEYHRIHQVSLHPFIVTFRGLGIYQAINTVISANNWVEQFNSTIQNHFFSQCYLGVYDRPQIAGHIWSLATWTDDYFNQLIELYEQTDNTIGRLFRRHINFEPGDDLIREYQFLGRTRKLVIPNLGDYKRIDLPEDLACHNSLCTVGKIHESVKEMNELVARIDWECIQIAHKMKDHQETTIPNGPYWII